MKNFLLIRRLVYLAILAGGCGVVYGLCNPHSRNYVIAGLMLEYGLMLYEIYKSPHKAEQ